jgi:hypothetical protein
LGGLAFSRQSASVNSSLRNIPAVQFSRFVRYSNESSDILAALAHRPKFNSDYGADWKYAHYTIPSFPGDIKGKLDLKVVIITSHVLNFNILSNTRSYVFSKWSVYSQTLPRC